MFRLITLGGLVLTQDGEPYTGGASQRLRLAILSILAAASAAGTSRDKVLAYLWPEVDEELGRRSLNQAVHHIRHALGGDAITSTNTTLSLNPAHIESDVAEFEAAIAAGAPERAVALYRGPFLDGIHLRNAPEFEKWVDGARARLARELVVALESLATSAAARRDRAGVVRWRQRLAAADPLNAPAIIALVEAHVAAGDRPGGLRVATTHAALVRAELGTEPNAEIRKWIARLQTATPGQFTALPVDVNPSGATQARPEADQARIRAFIDRASDGRYTVGATLGKTVVLTTFAVTDTRDQTPLALHVVSSGPGGHANPDRFVATLRRVATVGDPRVVPVLDVTATDECLYFVTPLPLEPTLRDRLARERQLTIPDALRLARDMAAALAAAHARGVMHADLRPKHIALLDAGVVVGGWGLIDALAPVRDRDGWEVAETAVTIAAPAYASPEQLEAGGTHDERSDIYSFGCVLFETLTGAPPFAAGDPRMLLGRKLTQPAPSARDTRDLVPKALDDVLRICLARSPADRYASGGGLADALAGVTAK